MTNKEKVYDDQIYPLMDKIIEICIEHKIAVLSTFCIGDDSDPSFSVTSALLTKDYKPTPRQREAYRIVMNNQEEAV